MAGTFIKVDVDTRQVEVALARLHARMSDISPALRDIGEHLSISQREHFELQAEADGTPWQQLKRATYERIASGKNLDKQGRLNQRGVGAISGKRILIESGNLMNTLHYQIDGNTLRFGSALPYAATHQLEAPERGIPARPFLGLSEDDGGAILEIVSGYLEDI